MLGLDFSPAAAASSPGGPVPLPAPAPAPPTLGDPYSGVDRPDFGKALEGVDGGPDIPITWDLAGAGEGEPGVFSDSERSRFSVSAEEVVG